MNARRSPRGVLSSPPRRARARTSRAGRDRNGPRGVVRVAVIVTSCPGAAAMGASPSACPVSSVVTETEPSGVCASPLPEVVAGVVRVEVQPEPRPRGAVERPEHGRAGAHDHRVVLERVAAAVRVQRVVRRHAVRGEIDPEVAGRAAVVEDRVPHHGARGGDAGDGDAVVAVVRDRVHRDRGVRGPDVVAGRRRRSPRRCRGCRDRLPAALVPIRLASDAGCRSR